MHNDVNWPHIANMNIFIDLDEMESVESSEEAATVVMEESILKLTQKLLDLIKLIDIHLQCTC